MVLSLFLTSAYGQFGRGGGMMGAGRGPSFSGAMARLFADNKAFTAALEMEITDKADTITMPGKLAFLEGKSRFEMDMAQIKGGMMRPEMAAQIKAMGMSEMTMITRPEKKVIYLVYPGLQAYMENPMSEADAPGAEDKFKMEVTEIGKETIDGHPCVKNKAVVTDDTGKKHESTVWNATDLKKFPIRIEQNHEGRPVRMTFKNVTFDKPAAAGFEVPKGFTFAANMQALMQDAMRKRMGTSPGGVPAKP